jgi:4-hydroxythreonine-4-phosphate dehydrogenase
MKPRIAITAGDPAGIGPEIAAKAAADPEVVAVCEPRIYGSGSPAESSDFEYGRMSAAAGRAGYDAIVRAVGDALRHEVDAIATAPINKASFAAAGLPWKGHTDLLAHLTGSPRGVMMFHSDMLRVVLATVHIPLAQVPAAMTAGLMEEVISLTASQLPRFGFPSPKLAVAGLNPHAGENGLLGDEEHEAIAPAIASCRGRGIEVSGAMRGEFDVVIACYHDQGLIPVKLASFGQAVNVTLGLPIIRTSVDHGTAFDIAGRGVADPTSMVAAVKLAAQLAQRR